MTPSTSPRIGLALGGGGARGIAHVHALQALDDLGLRPAAVAGTSIGALVGSGVAAGLDGKAVRAVMTEALANQGELWRRLWQLRPKRIVDFLGVGLTQFDAERVLEVFLPPEVPGSFAALPIPFTCVAADFYGCTEKLLADGPLRPAVAASMALPILFRAVTIDGAVLIDGGVVNPLPYDRLPTDLDVTLAVDVIGSPVRPSGREAPNSVETVFGASQILMQTILAEKLRHVRPDILVRPEVSSFRVLDFLKVNAILKATAGLREEVKRALDGALDPKPPARRRPTARRGPSAGS